MIIAVYLWSSQPQSIDLNSELREITCTWEISFHRSLTKSKPISAHPVNIGVGTLLFYWIILKAPDNSIILLLCLLKYWLVLVSSQHSWVLKSSKLWKQSITSVGYVTTLLKLLTTEKRQLLADAPISFNIFDCLRWTLHCFYGASTLQWIKHIRKILSLCEAEFWLTNAMVPR